MRTWDVPDGKERTMDVIKGYGRSMDQKKKELCKCDTLSLKRINVPCHRTIISESEQLE